nr:hypothetical protein [Angustibacter aerolatus]
MTRAAAHATAGTPDVLPLDLSEVDALDVCPVPPSGERRPG